MGFKLSFNKSVDSCSFVNILGLKSKKDMALLLMFYFCNIEVSNISLMALSYVLILSP